LLECKYRTIEMPV